MKIRPDFNVLRQMSQMNATPFVDYLQNRKTYLMNSLVLSPNMDEMRQLQGQIRELNDLLTEIIESRDSLDKLAKQKPDMSKAF